MPKILVLQSQLKKKDRKVATSLPNIKGIIKKRIEKESEDVDYHVITINTKWKLANVVTLINSGFDSLAKMEGFVERIGLKVGDGGRIRAYEVAGSKKSKAKDDDNTGEEKKSKKGKKGKKNKKSKKGEE